MKTKIAVFDFDGTLYPEETFSFLMKQLKQQQGFRQRYYKFNLQFLLPYMMYKLRLMSKYRMRTAAVELYVRMFKGLSEPEIDKFFERAYGDLKEHLYQPVLQELYKAKEMGYKVILVSGAVKTLLDKIRQDVPFDIVIGTEIPIRNGRYDQEANIQYVQGEKKVQELIAALAKEMAAGETIDWEQSLAFADSGSDLPVLELVGNPICVSPDEALKKIASERNWRIID